jgi:poly(A) polymerase
MPPDLGGGATPESRLVDHNFFLAAKGACLDPTNKYEENLRQGVSRLASRPSLKALLELAAARGLKVYLVGGTVRELLLGRQSPDLDLAVSAQTLDLARELAAALQGTFVLLHEGEGTARVVAGEEILDLAEFRAPNLEGDLKARDFSLNSMALELEAVLGRRPLSLIDPWGGLQDLARGRLQVVAPENLGYDPLRLLRAYRFAATHGFRPTRDTEAAVRRYLNEFSRVAGERVHQELFLLLAAPRAGRVLKEVDRVGLLTQVFPELNEARAVEQNGFHHLDVLEHLLETVECLEKVLAAPEQYLGELAGELARYAARPGKAALLKIAALFHDAGKPRVRERRSRPERFTFYYHEKVGLEIFAGTARRLRLSAAEAKTVAGLIRLHMRPFLLLSAFRDGVLTVRALGRLVRAARPELPGLFALAMADSLAGRGAAKPEDSEAVLAGLADAAYRFLIDRLEAQEGHPRLLSGHDLIRLGLTPGPKFRRILTAVEEAQWEGAVKSREEALNLARVLATPDRQD